MKIICPACNREVAAQDMDLAQKLAKCAGCNHLFSFADKAVDSVFATNERSSIEMPKQYVVQTGPEGLQILKKWFGPQAFFLLFFALFWNGIMLTIIFGSGFNPMMSFHVMAGVAVAYAALANFLNTTTITVGYDLIKVNHAPLPSFGGKTILRADIKQLYSQEQIVQTKNGQHSVYNVKVIQADGKKVDLINGLNGGEEALFIEQQIEQYLRLDDQEVLGELPR